MQLLDKRKKEIGNPKRQRETPENIINNIHMRGP